MLNRQIVSKSNMKEALSCLLHFLHTPLIPSMNLAPEYLEWPGKSPLARSDKVLSPQKMLLKHTLSISQSRKSDKSTCFVISFMALLLPVSHLYVMGNRETE
jgi:hypothetical protein